MKKNVQRKTRWLFLTILLGSVSCPAMYAQYASLQNVSNENQPRDRSQKVPALYLKDVLVSLETEYHVSFNYDDDVLQNISLDQKFTWVKNEKLEKILNRLFENFQITYQKIDKNNFLILKKVDKKVNKGTLESQTLNNNTDMSGVSKTSDPGINSGVRLNSLAQITGIVRDENGNPLPGATVVEKGTSNGTVTSADGRFKIDIKEGGILLISFLGYSPREVKIEQQSEIDIALEQDIASLQEVVVVGYGTQKKSDITGAIGSISGSEISSFPVSNSTQLIQGKVAGVMVTSESGSPGAGVNVRIRGLGTVNDNGPLYVIDGQPFNNMDNINPADIESIEILKDASASAIYGARAANGVVLITTKRGASGEMKITVESYLGSSSAWKDPVQLNSDEYYDMIKTAHQNGGTTVQPNLETEYQKGYDTNWWDQYTQRGTTQNYFLSLTGGSEKARYSVSGGYFKQEGLIIGTDYDRYTFRVNTDFDITKKLKVGVNLSLTNTSRNIIPEGARWTFGLISEGINMDPMVPVINPNADPNDPNYEFNKYGFTSVTDAYNPVAFSARTFNTTKIFRTQGNMFLEYGLLDGLVFRSNIGIFINNANSYVFNPSFYLAPWEQRANNSVSRGFVEDTGFVWENRLTYSKTFGDHNITAMAAFTSENYNNEGFSGSKQTIPSNDESFRVLQAATTADQITGNINSYALLSQLARVNYSYKDKYLLTATYRIDGSSRFANDRWGKFPSVAAGWKISEEEFFKNMNAPVIENLKIRFGWGQIGNQNIPNYSYLSLISGGNARRYPIGGETLQGYSPSSVGNPDIKWETVEQTNFGLDAGFFDDRLSLSMDYYIKTTKDMLLSVPLPYYLGYPSNPWSNEGSIKNSGIELEINYQEQINDFKLGMGLNFTTIKNEVLSLGSGGAIFGGQSRLGLVTKTEVGHSVGAFYGFVTDGIFQNQAEVDAGSQPNAKPGDIRFKDIAGSPDAEGNSTGPDGVINENDRTYLGSPIPKVLVGFNVNLQYKRFDLSVFLQGVFGNEIYSATKYFSHAPVGYFNTSREAYQNAWRGEGTSNSQPIISSNTSNDNYRNSSFYVEDGSFMRVKNIQLTYSIPVKKIPTGLQLYLSCQNLFTFTKYSGLDPELGSSNLLDVGIDYGVYPQSRTFMAGVKFNY